MLMDCSYKFAVFSLFSQSYFYLVFKLSFFFFSIKGLSVSEPVIQYFYICSHLTLEKKIFFFTVPIQMNQENFINPPSPTCVQLYLWCVLEPYFTFHFSCALCMRCFFLPPNQMCAMKDSSTTFSSFFCY